MSTSDIRITDIKPLSPPRNYIDAQPITPKIAETVIWARTTIENIGNGTDPRMVMLVGPCSIHDEKAGIEYAKRLVVLAEEVKDSILVVMRVYFEKPRTTVGWKGLINDPNLDGTFDMQTGLKRARAFLIEVGNLGLPAGTEFLDPFTPQYLADLVSWGAIGARTTESQTHRQMASGLSMPIGFKNGTGGSCQIAVDAMMAARSPHAFLGIDLDGRAAVINTTGNKAQHLILRGGSSGPNYDEDSVASASALLEIAGLRPNVVIDCSHANSNKDHRRQPIVFRETVRQRTEGNAGVIGLMLESHINEGNQPMGNLADLKYGVSITDACINWESTEELLLEAHAKLSQKAEALA
ncbi:MAG: 3-deoxy-7-phosphoheptulonate synthase [Chloroflexi bacterium]|nr:3-deoxy-7-phosphoheptulonate synthase [Chloroflexota bacterium]MCI0835994.1 3-deoxy-7-phosphoheptulonate synthase [Chloroflexota bacterium]MCI0851565.1 3-deoxy-7-phosphoheptulonate synthase [Chloroflexota bacterium]MCI0874017.1 3-deoxy-7-phosphoheptulonate synthase [Chloroflexota bacterium]MCI0880955.1 3-deoxy-7-phosphoheptulonate synthase [Chloroflexota bacterium]